MPVGDRVLGFLTPSSTISVTSLLLFSTIVLIVIDYPEIEHSNSAQVPSISVLGVNATSLGKSILIEPPAGKALTPV